MVTKNIIFVDKENFKTEAFILELERKTSPFEKKNNIRTCFFFCSTVYYYLLQDSTFADVFQQVVPTSFQSVSCGVTQRMRALPNDVFKVHTWAWPELHVLQKRFICGSKNTFSTKKCNRIYEAPLSQYILLIDGYFLPTFFTYFGKNIVGNISSP